MRRCELCIALSKVVGEEIDSVIELGTGSHRVRADATQVERALLVERRRGASRH